MPQRSQAILALAYDKRVIGLALLRKLTNALMQFAAQQDDESLGSSCRQEMAKLCTAAEWQRLK
ncbi:hypothetical protein ACLEEZ_10705 [Lonsdalea quercina]|uniref:hypothetical protein n=1 Tax=Lonsdalea quercina TaxID=71657 RepID=UPI00397683D9